MEPAAQDLNWPPGDLAISPLASPAFCVLGPVLGWELGSGRSTALPCNIPGGLGVFSAPSDPRVFISRPCLVNASCNKVGKKTQKTREV